jgi:ankyrin repeat protein
MICDGAVRVLQHGRTALHVAAAAGSECCVGWLLSQGAPLDVRDEVC